MTLGLDPLRLGWTVGLVTLTACLRHHAADAPSDTDDGDHDGFTAPDDCDDDDPEVHPGAIDGFSPCTDDGPGDDGIDDDCSGTPDDHPDAEDCGGDRDGDGVLPGLDCDDEDPDVHPGAADPASACSPAGADGVDEDCDGLVDDDLVDEDCAPLQCERVWGNYGSCDCPEGQRQILHEDESCECAAACGPGLPDCPEGEWCFALSNAAAIKAGEDGCVTVCGPIDAPWCSGCTDDPSI